MSSVLEEMNLKYLPVKSRVSFQFFKGNNRYLKASLRYYFKLVSKSNNLVNRLCISSYGLYVKRVKFEEKKISFSSLKSFSGKLLRVHLNKIPLIIS